MPQLYFEKMVPGIVHKISVLLRVCVRNPNSFMEAAVVQISSQNQLGSSGTPQRKRTRGIDVIPCTVCGSMQLLQSQAVTLLLSAHRLGGGCGPCYLVSNAGCI